MNAVILRCGNCGTSQNSPGECQACHEQDVRFYCTRHTPGLWLTAPVCSQCGAEFGKDAPPPRERRPAPTPVKTRAQPKGPERTESPPPRAGPWGRATRTGSERPRMDTRETIDRLLREYARRRSVHPEESELARASFPPRIAGGCLRIVLLAFLIMMVVMYALSSFSGMLLVY